MDWDANVFEWNENKSAGNRAKHRQLKHGIGFRAVWVAMRTAPFVRFPLAGQEKKGMSGSSRSKGLSSPSSSSGAAKPSASSQPGGRGSKKAGSMVSFSAAEVEHLKSDIDWDRINAMSEEEIEAAARSDPDWEGLLDIDWSKAEVVVPARKVAISIRLDEDVLAFFKAEGAGYQKRINAILRTYMRAAVRSKETGGASR